MNEIIADMIAAQWVTPLQTRTDVLETIGSEVERGVDTLRRQNPISAVR